MYLCWADDFERDLTFCESGNYGGDAPCYGRPVCCNLAEFLNIPTKMFVLKNVFKYDFYMVINICIGRLKENNIFILKD